MNPIRYDRGSSGPWIDAMSAKKNKGRNSIVMKTVTAAPTAVIILKQLFNSGHGDGQFDTA